MKVFTSLMKTLIAIVSIGMTLMLIMSVAPIVMGGIEVENTAPIEADCNDGITIEITGEFTVKSSLPKDIKDLMINIEAVAINNTGIGNVSIFTPAEPITISQGDKEVIRVKGKINLAEALVFLLADNNGQKGMYLPIQISISADYGGIAGFDMRTISIIELSENGSLNAQAHQNSSGQIYSASAEFEGDSSDMIMELIPNDPIDAKLKIDDPAFAGREISIKINKDALTNKVSVDIFTGTDASAEGIIELAESMLAAEKDIKIEVAGESFDVGNEQVENIKTYLEIYLGGVPIV